MRVYLVFDDEGTLRAVNKTLSSVPLVSVPRCDDGSPQTSHRISWENGGLYEFRPSGWTVQGFDVKA